MRLQELRKKTKSKPEDLARLLNISIQDYYKYESGRNEPNIQNLCKLADYYNTTVDYILSRETENDIGFLTHEQADVVKLIKKLNYKNLILVNGRVLEILEKQGEEVK